MPNNNVIHLQPLTKDQQVEQAHSAYRTTLIRSRYVHGQTLDEITLEFNADLVELEVALDDLLKPRDRAYMQQQFADLRDSIL